MQNQGGEFAALIGITPNGLYRIIHGDVLPDTQAQVDICACLGCSEDFLLDLSSPEAEALKDYGEALTNLHAFRSDWSRDQKLFIVYVVLNPLSLVEEVS